jgi:8-oxo-dGTP pyrophosphatase MutT (NUDIX family)
MRDFSYGIIPLRKGKEGWEALSVLHRQGFWGFPKGHAEEDEEPKQAAERELFEETGLKVVKYLAVEEFSDSYQFSYHGKRIDKTVIYYVAEVAGEVIPEPDEIVEGRWSSLEHAHQQLTYPASQEIIRKVHELLMKEAGKDNKDPKDPN